MNNAIALGVPPLDVAHESFNWKLYKLRLEQFFKSNKNEDENAKRNILLTVCTDKTLVLLQGLCSPIEPSNKTYDQLCIIIETHFTTPKLIFQERRKFYEASKNDDENVTDYLLRLRTLAASCNFADRLENNIIDKFITGLSGKIYMRLCEEDEWTIERALQVAKRYELNAASMLETTQSSSMNFIKKKQSNSNQGKKHNVTANQQQSTSKLRCKHCGFTNHDAKNCKYKNFTCNKCGIKGHMASVCKGKSNDSSTKSSGTVKCITNAENCEYNSNDSNDSVSKIFSIKNFNCNSNDDDSLYITLNVYGNNIKFQVDTGSPITAMPGHIFDKLFVKYDIMIYPERSTPIGYGGHHLKVRGYICPTIHYNDISQNFKILIIENGDSPILGRNFFREFNKKVTINAISKAPLTIERILEENHEVFNDEIGKLKDVKIKLETTGKLIPKFVKARPVPYAFRKDIEDQLKDLVEQNILTKTDVTDWGTPLVPILKPDGKIRICADYKITINPWLKETNHPLPRIQDLLIKLADGKIFSKIDLASAYNQLELDDESKKLVVWSTHIGNFIMNRLPFGIKPATGIFQRELEKVIGNIPGVVNFLDDIVISAPDMQIHNERLKCVLERLRLNGLRVNKKKCLFAENKIFYLGHILSHEGTFKLSENEKIIDFPIPTSVTEVKRFCGFVNFYGKFIENLSTKLYPIYKLLKNNKNDAIEWNDECDDSFKLIKRELISPKVLCHFNPKHKIVLTCDASSVGIGAILAHEYPDKSQRPIEYASRVLSPTEQKYSVIEKEALAIVFATKKFYQYLIGKHFYLATDHKPLLAIFGENKGIPKMSANRLQRWAFQMSAFNYTIKHVKSQENVADILSRLPNATESTYNKTHQVNYLNFVLQNHDLPIRYEEVLFETERDKILSNVIEMLENGDMERLKGDEFKPYLSRKNELTIENGVLMWGFRIIIPQSLRQSILKQLHQSHMGIVKTKSLARSYIWWPKIDHDIECMIKSCDACLSVLPNPAKAPVLNYNVTDEPWERIHIDYAGPYQGLYFLIILDSHSKWIEVNISKTATTEHSIASLRETFARFGVPKKLVSDNGTQFISENFQYFMKMNGIKHYLIAPQHPASNGAGENAVKTIKNSLKKALYSGKASNINKFINNFLFDYRTTQHCTTGVSPYECLFKFKPRTRFDLLKPPENSSVKVKEREKSINDNKFKANDDIIVKIFIKNKFHWKNAKVMEVLGSRNILCKLIDTNRIIKRHVNQVRRRKYNEIPIEAKIAKDSRIQQHHEFQRHQQFDNQNLIYFNIPNFVDVNNDISNIASTSATEQNLNVCPENDDTLILNDNEEVNSNNSSLSSDHSSNLEFEDASTSQPNLDDDGSENVQYNLRDRLSIQKPKRFL